MGVRAKRPRRFDFEIKHNHAQRWLRWQWRSQLWSGPRGLGTTATATGSTRKASRRDQSVYREDNENEGNNICSNMQKRGWGRRHINGLRLLHQQQLIQQQHRRKEQLWHCGGQVVVFGEWRMLNKVQPWWLILQLAAGPDQVTRPHERPGPKNSSCVFPHSSDEKDHPVPRDDGRDPNCINLVRKDPSTGDTTKIFGMAVVIVVTSWCQSWCPPN